MFNFCFFQESGSFVSEMFFSLLVEGEHIQKQKDEKYKV